MNGCCACTRKWPGDRLPKGQLPFSTDWFLAWQINVHASLFHSVFTWLSKTSPLDSVDALIKAYGLYAEQLALADIEPMLSITRAWSLVRFMEQRMLAVTPCVRCGAHTVTLPFENSRQFTCGLCAPPPRSGEGARAGQLRLGADPARHPTH